jgi:hypothetical protein
MEIKVTKLNEDGSVAFQGTLDAVQLEFILQTGINFLMASGASDFLDAISDSEDDDEMIIVHEGSDQVQ